jgi:hypothetical protein
MLGLLRAFLVGAGFAVMIWVTVLGLLGLLADRHRSDQGWHPPTYEVDGKTL